MFRVRPAWEEEFRSLYSPRAEAPGENGKREFLKTALETHPLWRDEAFWHQALQLCVAKQQLQASTLRSAEKAMEDNIKDAVVKGRSQDLHLSQSGEEVEGESENEDVTYDQMDSNILCWQLTFDPEQGYSGVPGVGSAGDGTAAAEEEEEARRTHTIIFAQMGGIVHSMLEFGVGKEEVQAFVTNVVREHNMPEEHRDMIMAHVASR